MKLATKNVPVNGKEIVVTLVVMGDAEGMFVPEVAKLLNVESVTIRSHISNHNLCVDVFSGQILDSAKERGLVSKMVRSINLLPRDTVKALVKIVNTPEAWSAYNYLWEVAESPVAMVEHAKAIGKDAELAALMADQSLSETQKRDLLAAMYQALRNNFINPTASYPNWQTGDSIPVVYIVAGELKTKFFGDIRKLMTWKDLPQRDFKAAIDFAATWKLNEKKWAKILTARRAWAVDRPTQEPTPLKAKRGRPRKEVAK